MAETGPDLTAGREAFEAVMEDECIIVSDPEGGDDDVLDLDTGLLERPDPDESEIYNGKCLISATSPNPRLATEGGRYSTQVIYSASLPVSASGVADGQILTITASRRDPELVDKEFRVTGVLYDTFAISRDLTLEART